MPKTGISSVIPRQRKAKKYGFTASYQSTSSLTAPLSPFLPLALPSYMSMEETPAQRLYGPIDRTIHRELHHRTLTSLPCCPMDATSSPSGMHLAFSTNACHREVKATLSQRNIKAHRLEIARFRSALPLSPKAKSNASATRKRTGYAALPLEK